MRVLLCHNNFTVYGGAEVFVHEIARVLTEQGHSVAFLASQEAGEQSEWSQYFPKSVDYRASSASAILRFPQLIYSGASKTAARRIVRDFKPDLVHCFAIYTKLTPSILDVFRKEGVPVVCSFNDYKHICPNYKLFHHGKLCEACRGRHFWHAIQKRCAHGSILYSTANSLEAYVHRFLDIYRKNVHTFLFASEYMARKTEEFWGSDSFGWQILRNPFDASKFSASSESGSYALFFGRLIDEKGVDVLLHAAAIAADVPVVIVGDGPDRDRLQSMAQALGCSNVTFMGEKWGDDMDRIIAACRYVVVPSLWHENFPYVILQSLAMGKPVVGSDRGGIPEMVRHGETGYVFDPDDASQLARYMGILANDDDEVARMGRRAKNLVDDEYNDVRFYDQLMQIYSGVTA